MSNSAAEQKRMGSRDPSSKHVDSKRFTLVERVSR